MDLQMIYAYAEKLFQLPTQEIEKYLREKIKTPKDRERLSSILWAVSDACVKYHWQCDTKLLQKAGRVIFSELNYSKFAEDETPQGTANRLKELFRQTSIVRNINPYKIIYCQVLTDGDLKNDYEHKIKYRDARRVFENIYNRLKYQLKLTDEEACSIFERCSTLISKVSTSKIWEIYETLTSKLVHTDNQKGKAYYFFRAEEVSEILKINPSLFTCSGNNIVGAYNYLYGKVAQVARPYDNVGEDEAKYIMLRKWLKDNSSLLSINAANMIEKEKFIFNQVDKEQNYLLSKQFQKFFVSPTTLVIIDQISYDKIAKNLRINIETLKSVFSDELVQKYLERNPFVLGFDAKKFKSLIEKIKAEDEKRPEQNLLQKFFNSGRTIFAGTTEFSTEKVLSKLKSEDYLKSINLDDMNIEEKISKFVEIFMDGDKTFEEKLLKLIADRTVRKNMGEKNLRASIREMGGEIARLSCILKMNLYSVKERSRRIWDLTKDINNIQNMRLKLASTDSLSGAVYVEKQNAKEIEKLINLVRDAYAQKSQHIEKHYVEAAALYKDVLDYLSATFDDKEAISSLFDREISKNYVEMLKQNYRVYADDQPTIFGERLHVEGADPNLVGGLKTLTKEISREDGDMPQISFDK